MQPFFCVILGNILIHRAVRPKAGLLKWDVEEDEVKSSSNPSPPMTSDLKGGPRPPTSQPRPGAHPRPPPVGLKPLRPAPLGSNHPLTCTFALDKDGEAAGPKTKLRPFLWNKVLANSDDSMVWNQIKSGAFQ
ncbi:hypothetical protein OROGR_031159 [Orobanche gracilis]